MQFLHTIMPQYSSFYCVSCHPCEPAYFDTSCNTTPSMIKNQIYFLNDRNSIQKSSCLLSERRPLFHCTICQPCESAYFDPFMLLHMSISKTHSSSRNNCIPWTMKCSTGKSTRPPSTNWLYMYHHLQLSSLTYSRSIIDTNLLTLSAMHT